MEEKYDSLKIDALDKLQGIIESSKDYSFEMAMESRKAFTNHPFFSMSHKANRTKLFYYLEDDAPDEHRDSDVKLYKSDYIDCTRRELAEERLGSDKYFLIAGIEGNDDMCFLSSDFSKGIAVLYHDNVFCSSELNSELESAMAEKGLLEFFECLESK